MFDTFDMKVIFIDPIEYFRETKLYGDEDYDSICGTFYNGIIKLNEVL